MIGGNAGPQGWNALRYCEPVLADLKDANPATIVMCLLMKDAKDFDDDLVGASSKGSSRGEVGIAQSRE